LKAADIAGNTIDLATVVPLPVPVSSQLQSPSAETSNLVTRPLALSPCATQERELPLPGVPTLPRTPVVSSRTVLPKFIVGGYKVKSQETGSAQDDDIYKSHKYISDMAKTIAGKCSMFTENVDGSGQSYEEWRLTFANAVGSLHYVNDSVMGEWLRGQLEQDVANDVERVMGNDSQGHSIYRFCSAKVLDLHLQKSIYAAQLSDHHFHKQLQRAQSHDENPKQYVRGMVKRI
jgi:hypothetical protein